jgi:hypothetical protein
MASSTNIKFQAELEALLADNTAKEISAADVRTIVTSNYQPQMVWSGLVSKITSGSNSGEWLFIITHLTLIPLSEGSL